MNKSEGKYFNTAIKMDKAFLDLLAEKDFEYITVKDICKRAGITVQHFTCIMKQLQIYLMKVLIICQMISLNIFLKIISVQR